MCSTKFTHICALLFCVLSMTSCYTLQIPTTSNTGQLQNYPYAYIIPTSSTVSVSSGVYGTQYGVFGGGSSTTTNPTEVIAGYLMKKGVIILPEPTPKLQSNILIVTYGYLGKRQLSLFAQSNIVLIQFRDAKTQQLVASCEAEGCGDNEAQGILQAITRALDTLFDNTPQTQSLTEKKIAK